MEVDTLNGGTRLIRHGIKAYNRPSVVSMKEELGMRLRCPDSAATRRDIELGASEA